MPARRGAVGSRDRGRVVGRGTEGRRRRATPWSQLPRTITGSRPGGPRRWRHRALRRPWQLRLPTVVAARSPSAAGGRRRWHTEVPLPAVPGCVAGRQAAVGSDRVAVAAAPRLPRRPHRGAVAVASCSLLLATESPSPRRRGRRRQLDEVAVASGTQLAPPAAQSAVPTRPQVRSRTRAAPRGWRAGRVDHLDDQRARLRGAEALGRGIVPVALSPLVGNLYRRAH